MNENKNDLQALLQLRILVGYLGERSQFAWWQTSFFEAASRAFMEPVFAKTSRLAQYHGVVEAARRLHDEHLNVGSFHLFRLPEEIEQDLHSIMQSEVGDRLTADLMSGKDDVLRKLTNLGISTPSSQDGPQSVGSIAELDLGKLKHIAGLYASAFAGGKKAYPYLVS